MTFSKSAVVKKARLDQEETTIGASPILRTYNGTIPATSDTALSGNTLIAEGTLPADWMAAATNTGNVVTKAKTGSWSVTGQSGAGSGTASTFFRIYASDGTTCHYQGSVSAVGGGGEMTLDNNSIATGQSTTVNTFTLTAGN
jgi:hypothetical protein